MGTSEEKLYVVTKKCCVGTMHLKGKVCGAMAKILTHPSYVFGL